MSESRLSGKRVLIFIDEGFSSREFSESKRLLEADGATVLVAG